MQCLQFPIATPCFGSHHIIINEHLSIACCINDLHVSSTLKSCGAVKGKDEIVDVEAEKIPRHVGVIMDGNRRWAASRGLPPHEGHRAGGKAMVQVVKNCMKHGVKVVSVFAFSTENWIRPQDEVTHLMNLFQELISADMKELSLAGMRFTFLGNTSELPVSLQKLMSASEDDTKTNDGLHLVLAINYSGRYDIVEATKKIATKVKGGLLQVEDIDSNLFGQHLETNRVEYPDPDLLIRTSGEIRVSNYMLWQLAYTEIFFTDKLFPDFDEADLIQAFSTFQRRKRRYGR